MPGGLSSCVENIGGDYLESAIFLNGELVNLPAFSWLTHGGQKINKARFVPNLIRAIISTA
jgi:hypothetical protein